jgi:hypothetical protein
MGRPKGSLNKRTLEAQAIHTFQAIRFQPLEEKDPLKYLNERSNQYIQRLELIADEARDNQMPELELKTVAFLARMSPAYRTKVDVSSSHLGLLKAPNLENLSETELKQLTSDDSTDLTEIESKIIKEI